MNFLESAAILVPALTGMAMTIYNGEPDSLVQFEVQYCFSAKLQKIYTAIGMQDFLEQQSEKYIYEIIEPMESRILVFKIDDCWILLGPYMESPWNETAARRLLTKMGGSETVLLSYKSYRCRLPVFQQAYAAKVVTLLIKGISGKEELRQIKTLEMGDEYSGSKMVVSDEYDNIRIINKRYNLEERVIKAVSQGRTTTALKLLEEWKQVGAGIKFISDSLRDQIVSATVQRTDLRMGARMAGLSPVLIDAISQESAQKMQQAVSVEKLEHLMAQLVVRFCSEVQKMQRNRYSVYVRKAVDYIDRNLSRPITIKELSKAAGVNQTQLVKLFCQETGMTMKQYLAQKRCDVAEELLTDSKLSIQEISVYVGYEDSNYFTKVFKTKKGCSPQEYRKSHWPSI